MEQWSLETYSIGEIRDKCALPTVVKTECQERVHSNADLDLYQPLLLYKAYKGVKVQARLLYRVKQTQPGKDNFQPYGRVSLVIPKGYTGLFSLLNDNGQTMAKRYMMINDLVKASGRVSSSFLIHNCAVQAFRRISERHYRRTLLASGTVLRATGIFTDNNTSNVYQTPTANKHSLRQSFAKLFAKQQQLYHAQSDVHLDFTMKSYLKCVNAFQEEFFIPLTTAGNFYLVSDASRSREHNQTCVHFISSLILARKFPSRVKLIAGHLPDIPDKFTGYLQLDAYRICDVVLACTIHSLPYQLFEVDLDSEFRFRTSAVAKFSLSMEKRVRKALAFSVDQSDTWRRQMKIAHEVTVDGQEEQAEEEEHIYAEIGAPADCSSVEGEEDVKDVAKYSPSGSLGSTGNESTNTDTISYRLSVLSNPSRISFA